MIKKMRYASFLFNKINNGVQLISDSFDLEVELRNRGYQIATHGRIDWDQLPDSHRHQVANDHAAAQTIRNIIYRYRLTGAAMVAWSDATITPIAIKIKDVSDLWEKICKEDWDCWIISIESNWVIEKYHEGEVCFRDVA
jgi:hypothetical protein